MSPIRRCSRTACGKPAVATLTYVYAESTAVLGPLATYAEPHCYDLCLAHSERLTATGGWEVVRLAPDPDSLVPNTDDLEALADAVLRSARQPVPVGGRRSRPGFEPGRRGHLRVLPSARGLTGADGPPGAVSGLRGNRRLLKPGRGCCR